VTLGPAHNLLITMPDVKSLCVLAVALLLIYSCAGRSVHPVTVYQHGDETMSCDAIEREQVLIEDQIRELMPKTDKADKNTTLGVTGIFLIVPLFFMDLSKAEQIEVNALIKRYNHLLDIGNTKDCGFDKQPIPDFKKTDY